MIDLIAQAHKDRDAAWQAREKAQTNLELAELNLVKAKKEDYEAGQKWLASIDKIRQLHQEKEKYAGHPPIKGEKEKYDGHSPTL